MTDDVTRLGQLHGALAETLDALAVRLGADQRSTGGTWSVSDVWAHVGRWNTLSRLVIGALTAGARRVEEPEYWVLNARWLAEDEGLPAPAARRRFEEAFDAYRSTLDATDRSVWRMRVAQSIAHYEAHLTAPLEFSISPPPVRDRQGNLGRVNAEPPRGSAPERPDSWR